MTVVLPLSLQSPAAAMQIDSVQPQDAPDQGAETTEHAVSVGCLSQPVPDVHNFAPNILDEATIHRKVAKQAIDCVGTYAQKMGW